MKEISEAIPVPKKFTDKFPDLKSDKATNLWHRYLTVLSKYTFKQYLSLSNGTALNFPYKKANDECSTFNYKKKRYYVWKEFGQGAGFIQLIKKGNNITHQNSEIVITDTRQFQFFIDTRDSNEIINIYYGDIDETTEFDYVPIDMLSLQHYIKKTERDIDENTHSIAFIATLEKNLVKAKTIEIIASHFNGELPQRISSSHYGRRYYKGINLQNCHKMLRQACLGKCYEYDLKTAVYAIKLMLAQDIVNKAQEYAWTEFFPRTKEYIEKKQLIRDTLAEYLTNVHEQARVKLIKQVLTAVGFGATASSPTWSGSAIADIIRNKENRIELLQDEWLSEFIQEQKQLTDFIVDYYLKVDPDFKESIKDVGKMKVGNKYNKKQVMSYIFQTLEYQIMDEICKHIGQSYGVDSSEIVQLRVHDAIYTKRPISSEDLCEIKLTLQQFSEYLTLEHDEQKDSHGKFKYTPDTDRDIAYHKESIRQEETFARQYKSQYTDNINVKQLKGQREHNDKMLQTDTYLSMTEQEQQEYRRILNVQTNDDRVEESINKLINGENK